MACADWVLGAVCVVLLVDPAEALGCFWCQDPCSSRYYMFRVDIVCWKKHNFCGKMIVDDNGVVTTKRYCSKDGFFGQSGCFRTSPNTTVCYCNNVDYCNGSNGPLSGVALAVIPPVVVVVVLLMMTTGC